MGKRRAIHAVLSIFLIYHLFAVILAPNIRTYLGTRASSLVAPYIAFFELASEWGFFAPDPGPPPVYIEYEIYGAGGTSVKKGSWPEKKDPFWIRERQNRRVGVARFLMAHPERIEKMMGPYLCHSHSEAHSIGLWRIMASIPRLHAVAKGERAIGDNVDTQRKWVAQYLCGGRL